jgi:hypothetical protein
LVRVKNSEVLYLYVLGRKSKWSPTGVIVVTKIFLPEYTPDIRIEAFSFVYCSFIFLGADLKV